MPRREFEPDWAVHPGELLRETLDDHKLSQVWLARQTGTTPKHVNQVVRGRVPVTAAFAVAVAVALGRKRGWAQTLTRMQADYDVFHAWKDRHASS